MRRLIGIMVAAGLCVLTGSCGDHPVAPPTPPRPLAAAPSPSAQAAITPSPPFLPGALVDPSLPIHAPPVAVPLRLRLPTLGVSAPVLAVGKNADGQMEAPQGPVTDPVWDAAFWYRDGRIPGAPGIATFAGHVDDIRARPRIFANLRSLRPGDPVEIVDTRSGAVARFHVTEALSYPVAVARSTAVLEQLFGVGPVTERPEDRARDGADGISRLTLITCTGSWRNGEFDHRFVAYAVRDS